MGYFKVFCVPKQELEEGLIECESVSIQISKNELKGLIEFLSNFSDQLKDVPDAGLMCHLHLQDVWDGWKKEYPDIIVAAPPKDSD